MISLLLALIYVCFISLGLPDSLLGSAWPVLQVEIGVPMSFAGVVSMVISAGTIVSSLFSGQLQQRFGTGKVTAFSIATTAVALFGFSVSNCFWMLVLWAIPYGLGAGAVDAVLNNYVALHYQPQHMSWLHCMWGVGASVSPYIMGFALTRLDSWSSGYRIVSVIQVALCVVVFLSMPLWRTGLSDADEKTPAKAMSFRDIFALPGAKACFLLFFSYCSLEMTGCLWASSYFVQNRGIDPETAAGYASLFYIGITLGRGINGFLAMKCSDRFLIRLGMGMIAAGVTLLILPLPGMCAVLGFIVTGLGCSPIYPCIIHMTPSVFGRENSQALIGVQMAFAYTGFMLAPSAFGLLADLTDIALLPWYLLSLLAVMLIMHETVVRKTKKP